MAFKDYWLFLQKLQSAASGSRRMTRKRPRKDVQVESEALEVRVVPAAAPTLSITPNVSVTEGNSGTTDAVFTVTLSKASTQQVTVNYSTLDGTGKTADSDYQSATGTLTFAPGETTKTITVKVNGDNKKEADETFSVGIFSPTNAKVKNKGSLGVGKIVNDDAQPTVNIGTPPTLFEGNSGTQTMSFPVTLSNPSSEPVTIHYTTADGTATVADHDYVAKSGTLTFAPGETTKNILVTINGDTKAESDETFTVTISAPTTTSANATIGTATATGTIGDDDTSPVLSVNNPVAIDEGNTNFVTVLFTVRLSSASTQTVTVNYATADGTATTADNDYQATSGTLTFAPGDLVKTVAVKIFGDTKDEANENFTLVLSQSTNANIAVATGTATITDDDVSTSAISIGGATLAEGNSGTSNMTFHVTLSQASGQNITVDYATADGTATVADNDYTKTTGTITFAPGETDKTITVPITGDTKFEPNETFKVNLSNATNAGLTISQATGTITNDDSTTVTVTKVADGAETNPPTNGQFKVSLGGASSTDTVVSYSVDGTAVSGTDYEPMTGTVTIPAGQTSATINVIPLNDTEAESTETVIITLTDITSGDAGISLDADTSKLTATVNIVDSSQVPGLEIGDTPVTFTGGEAPINVLPNTNVSGGSLAGGKLIISVDPVVVDGKSVDTFSFPKTSGLGTTTGAKLADGHLTLTIQLSQTVTAADVQAFLRGITFSTKGTGLQTATRTVHVALSDAANHTSTLSQTINVHATA